MFNPSADATVWEQEDNLYMRARDELNIRENALQLLQPADKNELCLLFEMVDLAANATLGSFEMPQQVFDAYKHRDLIGLMPFIVNDSEWTILGFDICDINGFFSYLDMDATPRKLMALYEKTRLIEALVVAQAANLKQPSHAPYVVIRLGIYKRAIQQ